MDKRTGRSDFQTLAERVMHQRQHDRVDRYMSVSEVVTWCGILSTATGTLLYYILSALHRYLSS